MRLHHEREERESRNCCGVTGVKGKVSQSVSQSDCMMLRWAELKGEF